MKKTSTHRGPVCTCHAYPFPHRLSGGKCEKPEVPETSYDRWEAEQERRMDEARDRVVFGLGD